MGCLPGTLRGVDAAEHFAYARERALVYVDRGDPANGLKSFASDLGKHDGTASLFDAVLYYAAAMDGSPAAARQFIVGVEGPS